MKKIILQIIIGIIIGMAFLGVYCMCLYGQDVDLSNDETNFTGTRDKYLVHPIEDGFDLPKKIKALPSRTFITINDILDYAEECYNDSTVSYYRILSGGRPNDSWRVYCEKDSIDYWGNKCPEIWSHKKPTFEGFIEWLKK